LKNQDRFLKRRQRLIGPDGNTLRALELLTNCYIVVQGKTVSAIGGWKGLRDVRTVVEDCMKNVHPIYHVKTMMIKRELSKNPDLQNEDWERFLPKFKKKNIKKKKKNKKKKKKDINPFPPPPQKRKEDIELETGEYFLKEEERRRKKLEEKKQERKEKALQKQKVRETQFQAPAEIPRIKQEQEEKEKKSLKQESTKELSDKIKSTLIGDRKRKIASLQSADSFVVKRQKTSTGSK